jgi:ubiquinone biosynthesis protein
MSEDARMKLARLATITTVFLEEGLGFLTERKPDAPKGENGQKQERPSNAELAKRLRRTLERLGPTFVKFGQMLGTRVDLFGEEVIAELSQLHSHVAPFPTDQAITILESELKATVGERFADFPAEPIAAASIAQVYKARLPGDDERWVAVKVQRPGLETSLLSDLEVLVEVSGFIDVLVPPYRRSMVHRVAEEYAQRAKKEIDFLAEASAMEEFADVLTTLPEFRVPHVHRELCTSKVLVMEWLEGAKLDTIKTKEELASHGFEPEAFGRSMLRLQLSMSYEHGFVHGDTHPGNIILLPSGHVGLIDFGLHARVPRGLREKMLEMLFYQASGRIDEAVSAFVTVLSPDASVDRQALEADLKKVLAAGGAAKSSVRENRVTEQIIAGMRVGSKYQLKAQSDLFMVVRNLTIVEGIVLRYSPELDPAAELKEITGGILRRKLFGPSMREEMSQLLPQIALTLSKRPQLIERLMRLERAFTDSRNLGDFLRRERVLEEPVAAGNGALKLALVGLLGLAAGYALHTLFG